MTKIDGTDERHVELSIDVALTDRRLLLVAAEGPTIDAGSIAYGDLVAVSRPGGDTLELATVGGVRWRLDVPETERVDAALTHLRWLGKLRSRCVRCRNDVEMAAGEIRTAAESRDWEGALATYGDARDSLDRLVCALDLTEPIETEVLAPELTDIEQTLETAHTRLHVERAASQLELGRQLVENEDYEQARKVLRTTQEYYERACEASEAVLRGDAFQFGTQRGLDDELKRLGWELEAVAAEPLRQAHEARIRARDADDSERAIEGWERAFRRYGNVLSLEWGDDDRYFAGDPDDIREEMTRAADRLVELRREVARESWNEGARRQHEGETKTALRQCLVAKEHMERAHELAVEFFPEDATSIDTQLTEMSDVLSRIRETATVDAGTTTDADPADGVATGTGVDTTGDAAESLAGESDDRSLTERLRELDTHHEITFELDGEADDLIRELDHETDTGDRSVDTDATGEGDSRERPERATQGRNR